LKAADGTGAVERLTESENVQFPYPFTPDGKRLVFVDMGAERSNLVDAVLDVESHRYFVLAVRDLHSELDRGLHHRGRCFEHDLEKPGDSRRESRDHVLDRVGIHVDPPNEQHVVSAPLNNEAKPWKAAFCRFGENLHDVLVPPANERRALLFEAGINDFSLDAVLEGQDLQSFGIDDLDQAIVFRNEMHPLVGLGRTGGQEDGAGGPDGVVDRRATESSFDPLAYVGNRGAGLAGDHQPFDPEIFGFDAGLLGKVVDEVLGVGGCTDEHLGKTSRAIWANRGRPERAPIGTTVAP